MNHFVGICKRCVEEFMVIFTPSEKKRKWDYCPPCNRKDFKRNKTPFFRGVVEYKDKKNKDQYFIEGRVSEKEYEVLKNGS